VHTGQFGHLGDPPSVTLAINLDAEGHVRRIPDLRDNAQRPGVEPLPPTGARVEDEPFMRRSAPTPCQASPPHAER
jgi:hypothetical protein